MNIKPIKSVKDNLEPLFTKKALSNNQCYPGVYLSSKSIIYSQREKIHTAVNTYTKLKIDCFGSPTQFSSSLPSFLIWS